MKKSILALSILIIGSTVLTACWDDDDSSANDDQDNTALEAKANLKGESKAWFEAGQVAVANNSEELEKIVKGAGAAKNIILFVGDGMGVSTVTAARILDGQQKGMMGEENLLSFEKMPYTGLIKTYNTNQQVPDSAGTMTAMMTGVKTKAGVININDNSDRGTCGGAKGQRGKELVTALELASMAGKSTGIVSTARLTHATPAATYAKTSERGWESNDKLNDEARKNGCKDIATQFVESPYIDVAFAGGRRHFIPKTMEDLEGKSGKRTDGKNLVEQWKAATSGVYVEDQAGFNAIADDATKVLGLFNSSHMEYEVNRQKDKAGEPSLTEMTTKSIDLLSNNDKGYFLMVEAGRIDHGHHGGSAYKALNDTIELSEAVAAAMEKTSAEDTLIIVTADHSHVFTIAGYPTRGNPILGKVIGNNANGIAESTPTLAKDDMPYTTLGYANGQGVGMGDKELEINDGGRANLANIDTTDPDFYQEALVPTSSETHAGEDVGVYARGPGAHLLKGTSEQNVIFHVMNHAANLVAQAEAASK